MIKIQNQESFRIILQTNTFFVVYKSKKSNSNDYFC